MWRRRIFRILFGAILFSCFSTTPASAVVSAAVSAASAAPATSIKFSPAPVPSANTVPSANIISNANTTNSAKSPLVVIGFSGVRFSHLKDGIAPHLAAFTEEAVTANLVVRTLADTTCSAAGWLSLATGTRAAAPLISNSATCLPIAVEKTTAGEMQIKPWGRIAAVNEANPYQPSLGALATALQQQNISAGAIGANAALALSDRTGKIYGEYLPIPTSEEDIAHSYRQLQNKDVVFIDAGDFNPAATDAANPAATEKSDVNRDNSATSSSAADSFLPPRFRAAMVPPPPDSSQLLRRVEKIDKRIGSLLAAIPKTHNVVLLSLADGDGAVARMQYFALRPAAAAANETTAAQLAEVYAGGSLASAASTRQPGIVQLRDILPTIYQLLGIENNSSRFGSGSGSSVGSSAGSSAGSHFSSSAGFSVGSSIYPLADKRSAPARINYLADIELRSVQVRAGVVPFYILLGLLASIALLIAVKNFRIFTKRKAEKEAAVSTYTFSGGKLYYFSLVAALPVASFLINLLPWWRLPAASIFLLGGMLFLAAICALVANFLRHSSPLLPSTLLAALTASVLAIDALCGSALHFSSLLGDQPQSGGRFYGFSNAPFVIFALSLLFCVGATLHKLEKISAPRSLRYLLIIAVAVLGIFLDGSPSIGADFGGPPALFLAFFLLLLLHRGKSIRLIHLFLTSGAALLGMFGIAYLDWRRAPALRSHFGEFFASLLEGQGGAVIGRKVTQLLNSVPIWAWGIGIFISISLLWVLWHNRGSIFAIIKNKVPGFPLPGDLLSASIAALFLLLSGMLINDSGLVMLFIGLCYGVPLWLNAMPRNAVSLDVMPLDTMPLDTMPRNATL